MRLTKFCYAVTGLGYSAPWCVNAGFIAGTEATLIVDTGANALAGATIHGYAVAARPANRLIALNTEKHFDHIGGNSYVSDRGVEIWGHPGIARTEAEFRAEVTEFNDAIPNAARRERREAEVFFTGTRLTMPDHALTFSTTFPLGDCHAEILFTPGHTPTNVSVWIPEDRVLYTGDCLINGYLPNLDAGGPANWLAWLDSLDRVLELKPAIVVAGHGPVATGADVPRIISVVRNTLEEALERGHSPTSPPV